MHRTLLLSALLLTSALVYAAENATAPLTGCAAKHQAINAQLEIAKSQGNSNQQAGLEKALKQVQDNCTDSSLRTEREAEMAKAEEQVSEREIDLREALAKGDQNDISKRQSKLHEARATLQQTREALMQ